MTSQELNVIQEAISSEHELGSDLLYRFERLGEPAFHEIARLLRSGTLTQDQQVFALRMLSLLTRHNCWDRKDELLDLALDQSQSSMKEVRSGAVHVAIVTTHILERFPNHAIRRENQPGAVPALRQRVQKEVARALATGLNKEQEELAREFLGNTI